MGYAQGKELEPGSFYRSLRRKRSRPPQSRGSIHSRVSGQGSPISALPGGEMGPTDLPQPLQSRQGSKQRAPRSLEGQNVMVSPQATRQTEERDRGHLLAHPLTRSAVTGRPALLQAAVPALEGPKLPGPGGPGRGSTAGGTGQGGPAALTAEEALTHSAFRSSVHFVDGPLRAQEAKGRQKLISDSRTQPALQPRLGFTGSTSRATNPVQPPPRALLCSASPPASSAWN